MTEPTTTATAQKRCTDQWCVDGWTTTPRWGRIQVVPCPTCNPQKARQVYELTGTRAR